VVTDEVTHVGVQILGFGPAALGVFVAADRLGLLDSLLATGVLVLEREPTFDQMTRRLFPWQVRTNSLGREFVDGLARAGRFGELLADPAIASLALSTEIVHMSRVHRFMAGLAEATRRVLVESGNSPRFGVSVRAVEQLPGGGFLTRDAAGRIIAMSDSVVLAVGAAEVPRTPPTGGPVIHSGRVLRQELGEVASAVGSGRSIRIVGDSHSAFSVVDLLSRELGDRMRVGQGHILVRQVRRFFRDVAAARRAGEPVGDGDVCPESGKVNRFDGLRGDALAAYERIVSGQDRRFVLRHAGADLSDLEQPAITIQASGYRARFVRIAQPTGEPLVCRSADGGPETDSRCRVLGADGRRVSGLYALGLGHSPRTGSGHRRASVNFFHGADGAALVSSLVGRLGGQRTSACGPAVRINVVGGLS